MIDHKNTEKIVPLFCTFEQMQDDEKKIIAEYVEDWNVAYKAFDAAEAALPTTEQALAKISHSQIAVPKSIVGTDLGRSFAEAVTELNKVSQQHRQLKADYSVTVAYAQAQAALVTALKTAVAKRNDRLYGLGAVAKRSLRFASADRRSFGRAATVSPIRK
jgi:hypothetical protein